jgi:pimeloyl-ACP methyl ester carboxylesterase
VRILAAVLFAFLASGSAFAQPPGTPALPANVPTPTDVKSGSINNEDIDYPYPVSYISSMGGILAARFAAMYPDVTERVALYDSIGLTDARFERPYHSTDEVYDGMLTFSYQQAYATIKRYFPTPESWKPEYEQLARLMYAWTLSGDWPRMAMVRTLLQQMVYADPVVDDWAHITSRALVIGGEKDGTDFPKLAKHIADTIPGGAQLVIVPKAGHVLHFETPDVFNRELLKFLHSSAASSAP